MEHDGVVGWVLVMAVREPVRCADVQFDIAGEERTTEVDQSVGEVRSAAMRPDAAVDNADPVTIRCSEITDEPLLLPDLCQPVFARLHGTSSPCTSEDNRKEVGDRQGALVIAPLVIHTDRRSGGAERRGLPVTLEIVPLRPVDKGLERALADAVDSGSLEPAVAYRLIEADIDTLPLLLEAARTVRECRSGRTVTYSRKVFLPLTNLCRDQCAYCTFVRRPSDPRAHTMTPEEVLAVAVAGRAAGCKEALFSLGDKPELRYASYRAWLAARGYARTIEYLRDMCALVLERTGLLPHANPGVMTEDDIALLRPVTASMGLMLETISERLLERGGAHRGCPDKVPAVRLETIEAAGRLRVPFTTGILIGIGETSHERVDSLYAIRALQDRYGHIQEVIVQNFRRKADIRMRDWPEPTLLDMLRTLAVARLILGTTTAVQAPPNLMPDGYDLYLLAGLDDWGGVSPVTRDFINPERAWPHLRELKERTERLGFTLRERLAVYPEYVRQGDTFLDPAIREQVAGMVDAGGLVPPEKELW